MAQVYLQRTVRGGSVLVSRVSLLRFLKNRPTLGNGREGHKR
jgi:hypothetical protein